MSFVLFQYISDFDSDFFFSRRNSIVSQDFVDGFLVIIEIGDIDRSLLVDFDKVFGDVFLEFFFFLFSSFQLVVFVNGTFKKKFFGRKVYQIIEKFFKI